MDIITKARHSRLWKSSSMSSVNDRLAIAVINSGDIRLGSLRLRCTQCHLGPGQYTGHHDPSLHQHAETQIEIPLTGLFLFTVNKSKIRLGPAQALLIPRRTLHTWRTPAGGFMMGIQLSVKDSSGHETTLPARRNHSTHVVTSAELTTQLHQIIDLVASRRSSAFMPVISSALLTLLITNVLEASCSFPRMTRTESPGRGHMIYEQIISFIRSNLGRRLSAGDLATQGGITFRQITRLFLKHSNESPHQYILRLRLEKAKATIESLPLKPIKEIAYESGFASQAHLSVAFKKAYGVSPSSYAVLKVVTQQAGPDS